MKIIFVDDDKDILENVSKFIRKIGHEVSTFSKAEDALNYLEKYGAHLVLSDIRMPGMDGHQLLDQIKSKPELSDIIVVLVTGYGTVKSAVMAMKKGAYDYLLKPIDIEELLTVLERIEAYIVLREEHAALKHNFDAAVTEATSEVKNDLKKLREKYAHEFGVGNIGIFSDSIRDVYFNADSMPVDDDKIIVISGEQGSGKGTLARYIHFRDGSNISPFEEIDAEKITKDDQYSVIFGKSKLMSDSGIVEKGVFEKSGNGTVYIKNADKLDPDLFSMLFSSLSQKFYYRLGGIKKHELHSKVILSTTRKISEFGTITSGSIDLANNPSVSVFNVPPLRHRPEEVYPLARMFILRFANKNSRPIKKMSAKAQTLLSQYTWPGNISELEELCERLMLTIPDVDIRPEHLEFLTSEDLNPGQRIESELSGIDSLLSGESFDLEVHVLEIVQRALELHKWNKVETSKFLGISRTQLYTYIKHINKQ